MCRTHTTTTGIHWSSRGGSTGVVNKAALKCFYCGEAGHLKKEYKKFLAKKDEVVRGRQRAVMVVAVAASRLVIRVPSTNILSGVWQWGEAAGLVSGLRGDPSCGA
ncbi:hypothetical protein Vafri_19848 [Volvox africanus]|uniref:CCHC-type domain-containing protein n=1 Tax=Volvox africanus TaxID=51714 RepID=A0A8J4BSI3_9CHLO|nr:hypothetical protein Vafri_19848 [Volvox africanus]